VLQLVISVIVLMVRPHFVLHIKAIGTEKRNTVLLLGTEACTLTIW
jgi:hypothetical protein